MGLFVLLTSFLYQRGSLESKTIEEPDAVDQDPARRETTRSTGRCDVVACGWRCTSAR